MRVDAHQHFWKYDPQKHSWIEDHMAVLRKDYLPADLETLLQDEFINGTVAVQADQSEAENAFLLELASKYEWIKGVVGWIDLRSEHIAGLLGKYVDEPKMKGFRHVVQGEPAGFLLNPAFINGVKTLAEFGFSYDILIFHYQLKEALKFVAELPEMRLVINHCAKPDIKNEAFAEWSADMEAISRHQHVYLKLSGLVTEADWEDWSVSDILPYIRRGIELFGADRVMIGSDWPVCTLAGSYEQVIGLVKEAIRDLSDTDQNKILGENAVKFYQL